MKNKEELLKLHYDWEKNVFFTILVILVASSFGITKTEGVVTLAMGLLIVVCIIAIIICFPRMKKALIELRNFYKSNTLKDKGD